MIAVGVVVEHPGRPGRRESRPWPARERPTDQRPCSARSPELTIACTSATADPSLARAPNRLEDL